MVAIVLVVVAAACSSSDDGEGAQTGDEAVSSSTTTAPATTAAEPSSPSTTVAPTTTAAPEPSDAEGVVVEVSGPGDAEFANRAIQDLDALGYTEAEYFFSGTARSFTGSDFGADGVWAAELDGEAPFTSRLVVRRPADPADFSGVVVVEWYNVSAGSDNDPDWGYLHPELIREGHAYVGVSAQKAGLDTLVNRSDGRYAELEHPGDEFSYDIYTQAGLVARGPSDGVSVDVWDGLEPTHVIALGESQSAFRLVTYTNAVHPRAPGVYDGVFIHSRGGRAPSLTADGAELEGLEGGVTIRTDLTVPVFTFQTETDVSPRLGSAAARQDDTELLRLWEVPGTAHADAYLLKEVYGLEESEGGIGVSINCELPVNDGPQFEVISAALHHTVAWVVDGTPPPEAPWIDTTDDDPAEVVRDADGIATGGIRTPAVDVPIAVLSGEGQAGDGFCGLFGTTIAFDEAELAARYGTPADYVAAVTESAEAAAAAGYLLDTEVATIIAAAETVEF